MFQPDQYISELTALLKEAFGKRLIYVGLQGSYLREEANENSDIDIMAVIRAMTPDDLCTYRKAIMTLEDYEKSCGFICGEEELLHWNPLEIAHLIHTTKDYYGTLTDLLPAYTERDVRTFIKMSLGNLYHEICHRRIHASMERNIAALPITFKSVFFILQNLRFLECGRFYGTKRELLSVLNGKDRQVLEMALALGRGEQIAFDEAFSLLYFWCREALIRTTSDVVNQ
ncbi:MAG: nucleotidyltransferase domain-containing protein [Clostridia bacterium]|nr:nucleotidyltransferase domain-containing protein [Clostridia bacterium]